MRVVADASPLILLARSELLSLLPTLFSEVLIPEAVWNEVNAAGPDDPAVQQQGLIPSVAGALGALRDSGLWLSDDTHRLLLQHAGESET